MPKLITSYEAKTNNCRKDNPKITHKSYTLGRYRIEYDILEYKYYGNGSYKGLFNAPQEYNYQVNLYEDDILIDSENISHEPCHEIIIGGDGLTRETTYYLSPPMSRATCGGIYDLNHKFIRDVCDAGDSWYCTFRMNDNYYITMGYDMCTHHIYLGVSDIRILFDMSKHQTQECPYENARIGLPTDWYGGDYYPVEATEEGIIVEKIIEDPTNTIDIDYDWNKVREFIKNQDYTQDNFYAYYKYKDENNEIIDDNLLIKDETKCKFVLRKMHRKDHQLVKYEDLDTFNFDGESVNDPLTDAFKALGLNISDENKQKLETFVNLNLNTTQGSVSIPIETLQVLSDK
jgi:hypothetical protein